MRHWLLLLIIFFSVKALPNAKLPPEGLSGLDYITLKTVQLDTSTQKNMAIIFLSAHCPCSASHESKLKMLARQYPEVRFVGVHSNIDEDFKLGQNHFTNANLGFTVIRDENSKIANVLGATKTPHVYLFDRSGVLAFQGGVDDSHRAESARKEYFQAALDAIRIGKLPEVRLARALGCSIQRER